MDYICAAETNLPVGPLPDLMGTEIRKWCGQIVLGQIASSLQNLRVLDKAIFFLATFYFFHMSD